jgi:hypothetical protein
VGLGYLQTEASEAPEEPGLLQRGALVAQDALARAHFAMRVAGIIVSHDLLKWFQQRQHLGLREGKGL